MSRVGSAPPTDPRRWIRVLPAGIATRGGRRQLRKRLRAGGQTLAMKVATTFYRRLIVGYVSLDRRMPRLHSQVPGEIRLLTEQDLPHYQQLRPRQPLAEIAGRLASGQRGFATWVDGRIGDVSWLATGRVRISYLRRDLILQPGDGYIYDSYTAPDLRARFLYQATSAHVLRFCQEQGLQRALMLYAPENRAPLAVARRFGVTFAGMYVCRRFGPWQTISERRFGAEPLPRLA